MRSRARLDPAMFDEHGRMRKEFWGEGPWQSEPDRLEWHAHGFPCLAVRGPVGAWCGYVGLPRRHPLYGRDYDLAEEHGISAHGGITFGGFCGGAICHNDPERVYWIGFDCAHYQDLSPALRATMRHIAPELTKLHEKLELDRVFGTEVYRTLEFVRRETEELARQLKSVRRLNRRVLARKDRRERQQRRKGLVRLAGLAFARRSILSGHDERTFVPIDVRIADHRGIRIPRSFRRHLR